MLIERHRASLPPCAEFSLGEVLAQAFRGAGAPRNSPNRQELGVSGSDDLRDRPKPL